jgi:hypothetical protein
VLLVGTVLFALSPSCTRGGSERPSFEQPLEGGGQTFDESSGEGAALPYSPGPSPYCTRDDVYGPATTDYHSSSCGFRGVWQNSDWTEGAPTPPGPYECSCDGQRVVSSDAADCAAALESACGVDFDGPTVCGAVSNPPEVGVTPAWSRCWPKQGDPGGWRCQCNGSDELVEQRSNRCEDVLFAACFTSGCSSSAGRCDPLAGEAGYDCTCADGAHSEWPGVFQCATALSGCTPLCETGAGRCSLRYGGYGCTCASASDSDAGVASADAGDASSASIFVPHAETYELCPYALELACGPMPAGEQTCSEEDEHGVITCTADGRGDWDCMPERSTCAMVHERNPDLIMGGLGGGWYPGSPALEAPQWLYDRSFTCTDGLFGCRPDPERLPP